MYACLHKPGCTELRELADCFSPAVEVVETGCVVFSIAGLRRLLGPPNQIASEIARRGAERGLVANLAIAPNPDSAILAARCLPGVTLIEPGEEAARLGVIPLEQAPMPEELLATLERWGLKTLADVAALPPIGLAERLGDEGLRLYRMALGQSDRPLELTPSATSYRERIELEHPASQLEPLLFLLARLLNELCARLVSQSRGTNRITTELELEDGSTHTRVLELPVPQDQSKPLLKLLQLDLEAHPPGAAVTAITLALHPVRPRRDQGGLFLPPTPEPAKLQLTLTRIQAIVGKENVGSPRLLDTHRPDAFQLGAFAPSSIEGAIATTQATARLALRVFRPPLPAKVRVRVIAPEHVTAPRIRGAVVKATGPWRGSGDWWRETAWSREEWDVALTDGALYRIFQDADSRAWAVEGVYD